MQHQSLRLTMEAGIAHVTLTDPDTANEIDSRLLDELNDAWRAIAARDDIIVTLLDAEGSDFCRGWEPFTRDELASRRAIDQSLIDPFGCLGALSAPVVAALQGQVCSAGLELALACDLRIAAEDAVFSFPDVLEGHLPLAGASQRLPRIAGPATALALLLAGESLAAHDALRCGLVSRIVSRDELPTATHDLANRLAKRGPVALRYAKELVHRGLEMPLDHALRYETDLATILQTTADRPEGIRAFFEKRLPHFEGK